MMKFASLVAAALFAVASMTAIAQEKKAAAAEKSMKKDAPKKAPSEAQKRQQARMKECNMQADDKKLTGDERKNYMSSCLKPAAKKAQAKKMDKMEKKADKKS